MQRCLARGRQIVKDMATLLLERGDDGHDRFDKPRALCTLRPEAAFAPEGPWTDRSTGAATRYARSAGPAPATVERPPPPAEQPPPSAQWSPPTPPREFRAPGYIPALLAGCVLTPLGIRESRGACAGIVGDIPISISTDEKRTPLSQVRVRTCLLALSGLQKMGLGNTSWLALSPPGKRSGGSPLRFEHVQPLECRSSLHDALGERQKIARFAVASPEYAGVPPSTRAWPSRFSAAE
jgi:hypothetical protein